MSKSSNSTEPRRRAEPARRRRGEVAVENGADSGGQSGARKASWQTFLLGILGGAVLWAALPPLQWSWLAWLAPVPWLLLIVRPALPGRRPYLALWAASTLHWLAVLQGIRLPFWALYFGWAALSIYLAIYLPLFVGLTRVAVHRGRWPLWLASPIVWVGLEYARGFLVTGFSGALLGHTLVGWVPLIQISDLAGAYGVSFLVMLVAACVTDIAARYQAGTSFRLPALVAAGSLAMALVYGEFRRSDAMDAKEGNVQQSVRVALLQGTFDTVFEYNPRRNEEVFEQYLRLAVAAAHDHPDLDLIVWPESTFTENNPYWIIGEELSIPSDSDELGGRSPEEFRRMVTRRADLFREKATYVADLLHPEGMERRISQMVGSETVDMTTDPPRRFNSAIFLDPQGNVVGRYDKIHRVMFGEYIPLGDWFPWIYRFSPMGGGLTSGSGPAAMEVNGRRFVPSICFESLVPHFVRWQLRELEQQGEPAMALVNLTHDGWFWGSSILDLHLTCAIFRAVEHRRPMLAVANPGLTAWIDGNGQIIEGLKRHEEAYVIANVTPDERFSLYRQLGDFPAAICLALCGWWGVLGFRRSRPSDPPGTRP